MSKEKQIEEMAKLTCNSQRSCYEGDCIGSEICAVRENCEKLYNAGYRKQSEGKWIVDDKYNKFCPVCGEKALYRASGTALATTFYQTKSNYCPNCGAKLVTKPKGGAE